MKKTAIIFSLFIILLAPSKGWAQVNKMSYVKAAEAYLGKEWAELPDSVFARFKTDGNRVEYEGLCFERRRQLAMLVMGEVMEGKGRFMPDIIKGLETHIAEPWWGIPAHYNRPKPVRSVQPVDLFNAETAGMIAWTAKVLSEKIDSCAPGLNERIAEEIHHRILRPALGSKDWWKKAGMNWNPWICSNWLTCVIMYEKDAERRQRAIEEIEGCMDAFISQYPEDGGCDEGTGYWDRAAASLYECMQLLHDAGVDDSRYRNNPKVRNMGAYIYRMYIANDYCVNFADAHENRNTVQLNVLYPFAVYMNDPVMRSFAAYIAQRKDFFNNPAALYLTSGNFPTLGRELRLLEHASELKNEKPAEPQVEAWLPDLQIATLRYPTNGKKAKNSLYVAMKGGHNDESHNHNDVGSFIVYADGNPLLIDPGVGEYTSQTFGKDRYSIWTMQSQYHNLPQINGIDERNGKEYRASVVEKTPRSLSLDITKAYPSEAKLKSWIRTISLNKGTITLTDDYSLYECNAPTRLMFITPVHPDASKPGIIRLGKHSIKYDKLHWTPVIEDISDKLDPVLTSQLGTSLYRIVLTESSLQKNSKSAVTIH